jgi:uncharacterized protein (DUF779 family)
MHFTVRRHSRRRLRAGFLGAMMGDRPNARATIMVDRVIATETAEKLIRKLREAHGPLLFHQSGGCCDGSSPMCYPLAEFRTGPSDVCLGEIAGCRVYIGAAQFELWEHTQLVIDVVAGRGAGFSVEAPEGVRFLTRGRVFSAEERASLAGLSR